MTSFEINPRDLRVSDAEREYTINLLERATGRGLIDLAEFSDRSSKAIAAKTRADLNALLIDLPGLQLSGQNFAPAGGSNWPAGAERPPDPSVLDIKGYGSRQFTGHWLVPPLITITGTGAGTKLDFTQAQLTSATVTIEFRSNLGGGVEFRVPAGTAVRYDQLDLRGCAIHNKVIPTSGPPPMLLNLVGIKRSGSITIRPPKRGLVQGILDGIADSTR